MCSFCPADTAAIQRRLLRWYARAGRDLPFRRTRDPYAIWISEIMLQQTRVETVLPYYRRFLRRFPNVRTLARTKLDDVLKLWEGLGYYARARNLHRAARQILDHHAGRFPTDLAAIRSLRGVGPYTAGAIASIAFGLDQPALDGNVRRVLIRLACLTAPTIDNGRLWELAASLLPAGRAGDFNQALMDLGATVCLPRQPRCPDCPLRANCKARQKGLQDRLPRKKPRKPLPHYDVVAAVILKRGRVLISRRKPEALLGGLWEFPGGKVQPRETHAAALRRELREELGIEISVGEPLAVVRHAYSHFRITLRAFLCRHLRLRPRRSAARR